MALSDRILALRSSLNLSQDKFGELVGKSQRTVAAWEAGSRSPSFAVLCALADKLNVSVDYLLGRTEIPNIYLDTKKDPSPEDRERALSIAAAARSDNAATEDLPQDVEALSELIREIVRQELDTRLPHSDGRS